MIEGNSRVYQRIEQTNIENYIAEALKLRENMSFYPNLLNWLPQNENLILQEQLLAEILSNISC